jgi:succinate-semialdehyde dehydrogenase / glutarate-semialdehyde dehydrogenase
MAGNVVMVKHSGTVPQCALAFEKLWQEAGAPVGAYTNLFVSYDQVNRAIDDPRIKGVALTGSEVAGAKWPSARGRTSKIHPRARRQRCLYRAGGRRSRGRPQMGALVEDE